MPPFVLSLNNVMMQYLEALDRPGGWGNLIDVLDFLSNQELRNTYFDQTCQLFEPPLLTNQALPVLMVPPEHRQRMQPIIARIQTAIGQTSN